MRQIDDEKKGGDLTPLNGSAEVQYMGGGGLRAPQGPQKTNLFKSSLVNSGLYWSHVMSQK